MSLAGTLAAGRRAAEARMGVDNGGSTATVWREDPDNPVVVDGLETTGWTMELASLPGRIASNRGAAQTRTVTIGQTEVQLAVREWHCPTTSREALREGDVLEVIAGESVGLFLKIIEATGQDQATACRLPVIEIQKPEGIS